MKESLYDDNTLFLIELKWCPHTLPKIHTQHTYTYTLPYIHNLTMHFLFDFLKCRNIIFSIQFVRIYYTFIVWVEVVYTYLAKNPHFTYEAFHILAQIYTLNHASSHYRYTQLQYRFAVISEAPSTYTYIHYFTNPQSSYSIE